MTQETPNSPNQLMAKILENALVYALKPVVERLDQIEDRLIDHECFPPHKPQLEALTKQVQQLTERLNQIEEKLDQRLSRQDEELLEMSSELALVGESLTGVTTNLDKLSNDLEVATENMNEFNKIFES